MKNEKGESEIISEQHETSKTKIIVGGSDPYNQLGEMPKILGDVSNKIFN